MQFPCCQAPILHAPARCPWRTGMVVLHCPRYVLRFTASMGLNITESCNMLQLLEVGWTAEHLCREQPLDQQPGPEASSAN